MRFINITLFALALCVCAPGAKAADLTEFELKAAKELYLTKCAKCHEFHPPTDYKKPEWDKWMQKMGKKSRLTPDQFSIVARYTENLRAAGEKK